MQRQRILIFGKTGQIGWELRRTLACLGETFALEFPRIDFTHPASLRDVIRCFRPHVIVNAVAYTSVDKAEDEPRLAAAINSDAPAVLAEEAAKLGALLVHYSTDYVFDGSGTRPWSEDDMPAPLNVYGKTKLAGDKTITASGCRHLIFRTSWVYGSRGNNFLLTLLRKAREGASLRIVDDQIGAPTSSRCIAEATAQILSQWRALEENKAADCIGTYHMVNTGTTSWYEFAQSIFELACPLLRISMPVIEPVKTKDYIQSAVRPLNSRLSCLKMAETFGLELPTWKHSLEHTLESMVNAYQRADG